MMHPSPEEVRAEARYRGHTWAEPKRRIFAAGTNRVPVQACAWCGAALSWWSAIRMAFGLPAASHGICGTCAREHFPHEEDPATEATVTGPERSEPTSGPTPTTTSR